MSPPDLVHLLGWNSRKGRYTAVVVYSHGQRNAFGAGVDAIESVFPQAQVSLTQRKLRIEFPGSKQAREFFALLATNEDLDVLSYKWHVELLHLPGHKLRPVVHIPLLNVASVGAAVRNCGEAAAE